jgi:sec-independent protein translocase protein TatC
MLTHLLELRRRALQVIIAYVALFLLFFFFAPNLFHQLVSPLLHALPTPDPLIATQITTPLLIPIKLAADAAMLCTMPYALLHIWRFASPGLYQRERSTLQWAMLGSILLFLAGALFCFYIVLPFMLQFFAQSVPAGVRFMPDITYAVDFITRMLLLFGICFQVPLMCVFLVHTQLIESKTLKTIRPYVIVASFTIGMLLTPPDVLSQIMLAVPLCLLYELGIVLVTIIVKDNKKREFSATRNRSM